MAVVSPSRRDALAGLRTFKPGRCEVVHRVFSPGAGRYAMSFGVLVPFVLNPPGRNVELEEFTSIWEYAADILPEGEILDEAWPKPQGEFLGAGHCYPPQGHTGQPVSASISVGRLSKRLAVYGRRHVTATGGISAPEAFDRVRLDLSNAYGGEGHPFNPEGKGLSAEPAARELPNVEDPDHLMRTPAARPPVAGFGPIPSIWPERSRYLGKQDEHWHNTRWPHLPEDSDARYFMAARPDQHLDGFWEGGETVRVLNMHPEYPELVGQVPRSRPRFFVHQSSGEEDVQFHELNVRIDTVWLLPEARLGVLIFRSSVPVQHPDGLDVNAFYADFENPDEPAAPVANHLNNCLRAMAPNLYEGVPDTTSPEFKATLEAMSEEGLLDTIREQRQFFERALQNTGLSEPELLTQLEANPLTRQFAQTVKQRSRSLTGFFKEIESLVAFIQSEESKTPAPPAEPDPAKVLTPYPQAAEHAVQSPADGAVNPALYDAAAAARNRQLVLNAVASGHSCANLDLSHANLAGLDLGGMDFTGAVLAGANLAGAQLQGAQLNGVFASGARFDAANLAGCQLLGASLNAASFNGAVLRGANLDAADCSGANFSGAELSAASFRNAILRNAWMQGVRAERLVASGAECSQANLDNAQLAGAMLEGANFSEASAQRINLEDAAATRINLSQADLSGARLARADLSNSQTGPGTSLIRAVLDHATLNDASWISADLQQVSMQGVQAMNADFSDTLLGGAVLRRSDLRAAVFDRAALDDADLSASNLMEASFVHSRLHRCNFEHCNLYNATFKDTDIAGANFRHANLDRSALATE
ncbi:MAG TPA: DUF2169 domain-containing protein [Burkholderiaceae bacterium]|nr:DUF2169 domain-containing protein [Burkholderiaceae bacterium]